MSDPIAGAIAGSVASKAIEKVVTYIDESEDEEAAWRRSGLEVAIQAEAFYQQELVAGRTYDPDKIEHELNQYGQMAQQLAIRGEVRGFEEEFVSLLRELGNSLGEFADTPGGMGHDRTEDWEDMVSEPLRELKQQVEA
ncbi:hypothetical protein ACNO8S_01910 [Haloarcula sp. KBTZ06]|uniref:hypothetical protein n=1 Tax=Haloarcula sp. KBTZ06 TaxID=3402682 RepID=UPI003B43B934